MSEFRDTNLIFLISQQRAGSTLLQRIMACHPEIHTTAEPWLMLPPVYALRERGHQAEYNATLAVKALQDFCATLEEGQEHYMEAVRRMALYLYGTACEQAGKTYFVDKTPRYSLVIPELSRIFSGAKFIVLLRNPLAVLASVLSTWVKEHWILLARYRYDLLVAPRHLLEGIELLGDRAIVVHYESLVSNPAAQVEAICEQLGLGFYPSMLEYGKGPKPKGEMGDPAGVDRHTHPTTEHLEHWLEMGRVSQTRHFAEGYLRSLGPGLLAALGYSYTELETKLASVPCAAGKVTFHWRQVVKPDPAFQKRQYFVELALLEHRRLVHTIRQWRKSLLDRWF